MGKLEAFTAVFGSVSAVITALVLIIRPLREKVLGLKAIVSGLKCLLRADMLRTYYKNRESATIRQHEQENFESEYKAYKALGGNSFIDKIYGDVNKWDVIS